MFWIRHFYRFHCQSLFTVERKEATHLIENRVEDGGIFPEWRMQSSNTFVRIFNFILLLRRPFFHTSTAHPWKIFFSCIRANTIQCTDWNIKFCGMQKRMEQKEDIACLLFISFYFIAMHIAHTFTLLSFNHMPVVNIKSLFHMPNHVENIKIKSCRNMLLKCALCIPFRSRSSGIAAIVACHLLCAVKLEQTALFTILTFAIKWIDKWNS